MTSQAVIYARVSSREQEKEGYSIPAQLKYLNEYADKKGFHVVQEFTDNETAKKSGRTNFNEMLKFLKHNKNIRTVLVEKTDRLYRNFKDYVVLEDYDLEIHLVKEGSVLSKESKSHDKFIHGIKVLMAKNYIDNLSEEVKKGLYEKASQGYWVSKPPHGYKRLDSKNIVINENEAPFVKRAFELYAQGDISLRRLCEQLHEEGFIFKPHKPVINRSSLELILKNRFYTGQFVFKEKIYSGLHKPLISRELFERAQKAFHKDNKPKYEDKIFLFTNLIKCGECGCSIVAERKKQKYVYYHCTWGKGNCSQKKYVREEELEQLFNQAVKNIYLDDEQKQWIITGLKQSLEDESKYHEERIEALTVQSKRLQDRIKKIYIDKLDGLIDETFWLEQHNKWKIELEKIETIIQAHSKTNIRYIEEGVGILELAQKASFLYEKQNSEEKLKLLKILLSNSWLKDGKLSYEYKKPFDILAEGLGSKKDWAILDSNQ